MLEPNEGILQMLMLSDVSKIKTCGRQTGTGYLVAVLCYVTAVVSSVLLRCADFAFLLYLKSLSAGHSSSHCMHSTFIYGVCCSLCNTPAPIIRVRLALL